MTPSDEDITRALARLADVEVWQAASGDFYVAGYPSLFSPLTDWRDLGPLIEKYGVDLARVSSSPSDDDWEWEAKAWGGPWRAHGNPMRAACLTLYQLEQQQ